MSAVLHVRHLFGGFLAELNKELFCQSFLYYSDVLLFYSAIAK